MQAQCTRKTNEIAKGGEVRNVTWPHGAKKEEKMDSGSKEHLMAIKTLALDEMILERHAK